MEKLGREPDPDKAPVEDWHFPLEVQQALAIHIILSDQWDGTNGSYLGKDWAAIGVHFDTYKITDRETVTYFLKLIDHMYTKFTNEEIEKQRKAKEKKSQVGMKVPSPNIKNYGKK